MGSEVGIDDAKYNASFLMSIFNILLVVMNVLVMAAIVLVS